MFRFSFAGTQKAALVVVELEDEFIFGCHLIYNLIYVLVCEEEEGGLKCVSCIFVL